MTQKEKQLLLQDLCERLPLDKNTISPAYDRPNVHHFDYHRLIPMGLAIKVTEENNPYKI